MTNHRTTVAFGLAAALSTACGSGGSSAPDAAAAPDGASDPCVFPAGRSYVASKMAILPAGTGADFDGDSEPDNEFGDLALLARLAVNSELDRYIAAGEASLFVHLTRWSEPPTLDDADIDMQIFEGVDAEQPADPSNNLSGSGEFYAKFDNFDLQCQPTTLADSASLAGGTLTAARASWSFPLTTGTGGTLTMHDVRLQLSFNDDFSRLAGEQYFKAAVCGMSRMPFPGAVEGSVLDGLVNDTLIAGNVDIDMDVDGDGLEQVVGNGTSVKECIDGDGTVIPGSDCPCDPRIADAYSVAFAFEAVSANVLGFVP